MNELETQFKRFQIIISLVLLLLVGAVAFLGWQLLFRTPAVSNPGSSIVPSEAPDRVATLTEDLAKQTSFIGKVISVSDTTLVVQTNLIDTSKVSSLAKDYAGPLPTVDKVLTIKVSQSQIASTAVGDGLMIITKESPYTSASLTAVSISKIASGQ